jgi:hypothetical protein
VAPVPSRLLRVLSTEVKREHEFIGRVEIGKRGKLCGGREKPVPALRRKAAFLSEIGLAGELELRIGRAVATRFVNKHLDDSRPLPFFGHASDPVVGPRHGRQQQRRQYANDGDSAEQFDQADARICAMAVASGRAAGGVLACSTCGNDPTREFCPSKLHNRFDWTTEDSSRWRVKLRMLRAWPGVAAQPDCLNEC